MKMSLKLAAALISLATFASQAAWAASPPPVAEQMNSNRVNFADNPRSRVYEYNRNGITADGEIVVCSSQYEYSFSGKCYDKNDSKERNQWVSLGQSAPAGYEVDSYEWRVPGSGYRWLIVYYRKK